MNHADDEEMKAMNNYFSFFLLKPFFFFLSFEYYLNIIISIFVLKAYVHLFCLH